MDIGCYLVNTSRFIFGREPLRVTGAIAARPRDAHRSPDVDPARLRHRTRGRLLQHADGALSAPADLRHHRPHRAADSVQRAPRSARRASSSTPARTSSAEASLTSTSTSATSTRFRATCSRRRSSTTSDVPLPLEDAVRTWRASMPSSNQRTPDAGRYRSSRVHLPWSRLQHAERDGDGRRHRRRATRTGARSSSSDRSATTRRFPGYGTEHGVLRSADPRTVHAPPLMWSEALDRIMADLVRDTDVDWSRLRAISGSAQQHGSVYVNARARQRLGTLDPSRPLADQLERRVLAPHVADLDGFEHDEPVRRDRSGGRRRRARSPASPDRARSSASRGRRSASLPRTSPTPTPRPTASTSSARGSRPCSPVATWRSTRATARA